ncbi:hypothetical protein PLESTB_000757500 [Pleodorina starrii]|uniref:Uncharacterized protein n=1 Tax=Pleodorina starrii TaxID=330485 RepID=A0A9W6BLC4_9CHLO|nr:hypothetical protein PLESTM_001573500 [Pleodorina starrii]GLC53511.1 hypothetical protein PLESTB_000757500 [Pleodorina starrii]
MRAAYTCIRTYTSVDEPHQQKVEQQQRPNHQQARKNPRPQQGHSSKATEWQPQQWLEWLQQPPQQQLRR